MRRNKEKFQCQAISHQNYINRSAVLNGTTVRTVWKHTSQTEAHGWKLGRGHACWPIISRLHLCNHLSESCNTTCSCTSFHTPVWWERQNNQICNQKIQKHATAGCKTIDLILFLFCLCILIPAFFFLVNFENIQKAARMLELMNIIICTECKSKLCTFAIKYKIRCGIII